MLKSLLTGFGLTTLAATTIVDAQTPQTATQDDQGGLAEVVVSANRIEESLQRAALAIEAISGAELARRGVTTPEALSTLTTGVLIGTGGTAVQVYIRGVGNYSTNLFSESAVAFNTDGVYISRSWASRGLFFDVDRIEVLKGPQGTLYGRNASGGAINVLSARPVLGETTGYVELEGGNESLARGTGAINIPLGDTFAIRASGQITDHNGYLDDGYDDEKTRAARIHALYRPSDEFSILLTGSYQHAGGNGAGDTPTTGYGGNAWRGPTYPPAIAIARAEPGLGPILMVPQRDGFLDSTIYGVSAELNWDFGPATLTVQPAYRDGTNSSRFYVPNYQINSWEFDHQTSFEARLSNKSDRIKWVVGGFYFDESQGSPKGLPNEIDNGSFTGEVRKDYAADTSSYAAFGQTTFSVTDPFRLTAGVRYTHEHKTQSGTDLSYAPPASAPPLVCGGTHVPDFTSPIPFAPCVLNIPIVGDVTYNNVTYKGGFEFDLAPDSMLYASLSTGFKSGGFFPAPAPDNTFKPEKLRAYELGVKNRFLNNRLQLNAEAFYWLYHDHQESHLGPTANAEFFTFITENAGQAKSYGLSVDLEFRATPADMITFGTQYNHTKYDSFSYTTPVFAGPPVTGCKVGAPGATGFPVDCAGLQMARAPTWSGNAGYDHTFSFSNGGSLTAGARAQYASSYYLSIDFLQTGRQDAFTTYDADLTYTGANGRWSVAAWGRNLSNEAVFTQVFRAPFVSPNNPLANPDGLIEGTLRAPRTYGLRARWNF